jgi:hypothetical protein
MFVSDGNIQPNRTSISDIAPLESPNTPTGPDPGSDRAP